MTSTGAITGGTVTDVDIRDTATSDTLVTMSGFAIDAVALAAAADAFRDQQ